jgi:lauroyl/myristoyl acyltransferase
MDGLEHLESSLQKGKGAVLMQFHFGSFLMALPGMGFQGIKINALAGVPLTESSYFKKKLVEFREREKMSYPFNSLTIRASLLPVAKALSKNEAVVMTLDGRQGANLVPIRLLERTALFSPGIFTLCMRRGIPILPLATVREPGGRHRIIIEPEMEMTTAANEEEAAKLNLVNFIRHYEKYLLNYPEHFAMTLYSLKKEVEGGFNQPMFSED